MDETKKIDKRKSLRVVTDNSLIDAKDLSELSLNARKLFYLAVSQCRKSDKEFYEYETTPSELAELWGVDRTNVYREADKIATELMRIVITLRNGQKGFEKRHLFEKCAYDDNSTLLFKLHKEMTDLLLGLKKDFSKPLVWDFMKMRSPYSMALWHLFQREMRSFKPMMSSPIEFELSLEELRQVTGCEAKLKQISEFKRRVLDKALGEIKKKCWVDISYTNIKKGRTVIGFRFTAKSSWETGTDDNIPYRWKMWERKAILLRKKLDETIEPEEEDELENLELELSQIHVEDVASEYVD